MFLPLKHIEDCGNECSASAKKIDSCLSVTVSTGIITIEEGLRFVVTEIYDFLTDIYEGP
jgi:hypothetical protein